MLYNHLYCLVPKHSITTQDNTTPIETLVLFIHLPPFSPDERKPTFTMYQCAHSGLFLFMCSCMVAHVWWWWLLVVVVCLCIGQRLMLDVFLNCSSLYFRAGPGVSPWTTNQAHLTPQLSPEIPSKHSIHWSMYENPKGSIQFSAFSGVLPKNPSSMPAVHDWSSLSVSHKVTEVWLFPVSSAYKFPPEHLFAIRLNI
jgi:hypothetical protein